MFATRLLTAAILLAAALAAIFLLRNEWWTALLLPVLAIAGWEWGALAGYGHPARGAFCAVLAASGIALAAAARAYPLAGFELAVYGLGCVFWIAIAPGLLVRRRGLQGGAANAAVGWIALVPGWLAAARLQSDPAGLLHIMGIVWLADTAAYLAGRTLGRRKLAPTISPGKTWEGVAGAAIAVAVYYVALSGSAAARPWAGRWGGALLFAGILALSVVGDLFESWMKRQAGVKDSGAILPGHGGILDRVDGLLAGMPLAALVVKYPG
jgi:phosphatidate cytidylyltransferase